MTTPVTQPAANASTTTKGIHKARNQPKRELLSESDETIKVRETSADIILKTSKTNDFWQTGRTHQRCALGGDGAIIAQDTKARKATRCK